MFSFFDVTDRGHISLVQLLLLHRQLVDRTLIKYEVAMMLKFLIKRNVHMNKGHKNVIECNYGIFSKLVSDSKILEAIQIAILGHPYPKPARWKVKDESMRFNQPNWPCPFTPYPDDASYQLAVQKYYPVDENNAFHQEVAGSSFMMTE